MLRCKVSVDVSDCKEEGKYMTGPMVSAPFSLNAWNCMLSNILVIVSVIEMEVIFKWLGILKGVVCISPFTEKTCLTSFPPCAKGSTCSHDRHDIIRFFHTSNSVFDALEDS